MKNTFYASGGFGSGRDPNSRSSRQWASNELFAGLQPTAVTKRVTTGPQDSRRQNQVGAAASCTAKHISSAIHRPFIIPKYYVARLGWETG